MKIEVKANNPKDIEAFVPVEGNWSIRGNRDGSTDDVEKAIAYQLGTDYRILIKVFHADGRTITGDLPSEGTFVACRH